MDRVLITKPIVGIAHMQVCAKAEATDDEILATCNGSNPSGTTHGWGVVIREDDHTGAGPVVCGAHPDRLHILVMC